MNEPAQPKVVQNSPTWGVAMMPGVPYKRGDLIGQWFEVRGILGKGGFGIVYLVYVKETGSSYALKTFREEYLQDAHTRERFKKEAQTWVNLGKHPNIVEAIFLETIQERLYIGMEFITPNSNGLNSLDGWIRMFPRPDLIKNQILKWAVEICDGMTYAYSQGIKAHRDLKPANILIAKDRISKITDFGLANVLSAEDLKQSKNWLNVLKGNIGFSAQTDGGKSCGTPTHMPPEQFLDASQCNEVSDIYSFGVILYQMVTGGGVPFLPPLPRNPSAEEMNRFWQAMYQLHSHSRMPAINSPLNPIIQRCLEKKPSDRYQHFLEIRDELARMYQELTGKEIPNPVIDENARRAGRNQAKILSSLGKVEEALDCINEDLKQNPNDHWAWLEKASFLERLDRLEEARVSYDNALKLAPEKPTLWQAKGTLLIKLKQYAIAQDCIEKALEIDPLYVDGWRAKGGFFFETQKYEEAIMCYERAIELDPRNFGAWYSKGSSFNLLNKFNDGLICLNKALELNPWSPDVWCKKGDSLLGLNRIEEAIPCYQKAIELFGKYSYAWYKKGFCLHKIKRYQEAITCYEKAIEFFPKYLDAWINEGFCQFNLNHFAESLKCYQRAIEIDPGYDLGWFSKGLCEEKLKKKDEGIRSYKHFLNIVTPANIKYAEIAREKLKGLGVIH